LNTSIEALDLSNTKLDKIPAEIAQYPQLKVLLLDINSISEMKGIEGLIKLEHLNLSENELTKIEGLEQLTALQELYLGRNKELLEPDIKKLQKKLPKCKISFW
jgi:Leucine-rich repeat (LRR) protein